MRKISTEDLLIESLFRKYNNNSFDDEIPSQFRALAKDITELTKPVDSIENTQLWIAFGCWLGFKDPITKKGVRRQFKSKWKKLLGASEKLKNKEKEQVIKLAENINAKQLRYVVKPECIVDQDNKTLVHLEELDDYNDAVSKATDAVKGYYIHMIEQDTH